MSQADKNIRPEFDTEIQAIVDYVRDYEITSEFSYETAAYDLVDSVACMLQALHYPACTKLLGPMVPGAELTNGARVLGTDYQLDPVKAAFDMGALVRWLDYNDTWLAAEWSHPSDNLGGILAVLDYLTRQQQRQFTVRDVLTAMIKAFEIQGCLALENSFNRVGLDHVILVKVATTAVIAHTLGADREQMLNAVSLAWVDGQSLRTYRHAPNTGSRKSWAAGDATSRGVRLALMAMQGETGYPSALTAKTWGFYDVSFKGNAFKFQRDYGTYTMDNILFKISYPAEFHAQTAVEAALKLYPDVKDKLESIKRIDIETQEPGVRIISKQGPLHNPADRDHCLQYMIAVPLIFGELTAAHYEDEVAQDPRIDALREKMHVEENTQFSKDYLDPDKRAFASAIRITFEDGTQTERMCVEYPVGHPRRREEGIPLLKDKFKRSLSQHFESSKVEQLYQQCLDFKTLEKMSVPDFIDLFSPKG